MKAEDGTRKWSGKKIVLWAAVVVFFCLGAAPQFYAYSVWHGSPFRTSLQG